MQLNRSDRREYPRVEKELPLVVSANGYDFQTTTQNVSCVGAYCCINKYVPPFTKIFIKLRLPIRSRSLDSKPLDVECKGVIVRTEDSVEKGFNIAIFFNDIKEAQKKKISQYLKQFLPQPTASASNRLS